MCSHSLGWQREINYQKINQALEGSATTNVVFRGVTVGRIQFAHCGPACI